MKVENLTINRNKKRKSMVIYIWNNMPVIVYCQYTQAALRCYAEIRSLTLIYHL